MQKANGQRVDFETFMGEINWICNRLGLNLDDYKNTFDFFRDVMGRFSVKTLRCLDERMGDDYLHNDLLGDMHRAVRGRLRELGFSSEEGARTA